MRKFLKLAGLIWGGAMAACAEPPPKPFVQFADQLNDWGPAYPNPATEGAGKVTIGLLRSGDLAGSSSVEFVTQDVTAVAGRDYRESQGSVVFGPGEGYAEIEIGLLDNGRVEAPRTFHIRLSSSSDSGVAVTPEPEVVSILDDEQPAIVDTRFPPPFQGGSAVVTMRQAEDGSIWASGYGGIAGSNVSSGLVRLDGDLRVLGAAQLPAASPVSFAFGIQSDGKLVVAVGGYDELPFGNYVDRFLPDGSRDATFSRFAGQWIRGLTVLTNDQVVVMTRNDTHWLGRDGIQEESSGLRTNTGFVEISPRGGVLLGVPGRLLWKSIGGTITRLGPGGQPDDRLKMVPNDGGTIRHALELPDGRLLIAGDFTSINGATRTHLARVLPTGDVDPEFSAEGLLTYPAHHGRASPIFVDCLAFDSQSRLVIGFRGDDSSGILTGGILRLFPDGRLDPDFVSGVITGGSGGDGVRHRTQGPVNALIRLNDSEWVAAGTMQAHGSTPLYGIGRFRLNSLAETLLDCDREEFVGGEAPGEVEVILRRVGDLERRVDVEVSIQPENETAASILPAATRWITFNPLDRQRSVRFTVRDDLAMAPKPTLARVSFRVVDGLAGTLRSAARVRILDDERPGTVDLRFHPDELLHTISSHNPISVQPDGRVLVWTTSGILRFESDGRLDPGFPLLPDQEFLGARMLSTGRILSVRSPYPHLVHLDAHGTIVKEFPADAGDLIQVYRTFLQTDGSAFLVAQVDDPYPGEYHTDLVWLRQDGLRDRTFEKRNALDAEVTCLAQTPDGGYVLGGAFRHISGLPRPGLARIHHNGSIDPTFDPKGLSMTNVSQVAVDNQGRVLVLSGITFPGGRGARDNACYRLLPDGRLDEAFVVPETADPWGGPAQITNFTLDGSGRVLVVGEFSKINGRMRPSIARLSSSGELDPDFGLDQGFTRPPYTIEEGPDGNLWVAGWLDSIDGVSVSSVAQLTGDRVHRFAEPPAVALGRFHVRLAGRAGYPQVIEATQDLQTWIPVRTNHSAAPYFEFETDLTPHPMRLFRVRSP
ncbi:MAG: hypothetical protein IT580_00230 [Verrucomicrobiales bacterium]|nr:hypothetical protein [Verrucomicrobiales bacterium]